MEGKWLRFCIPHAWYFNSLSITAPFVHNERPGPPCTTALKSTYFQQYYYTFSQATLEKSPNFFILCDLQYHIPFKPRE